MELNASESENEKAPFNIDDILDNENNQNKKETWNKLNKTLKLQKLHYYSEKYGKEHKYSAKEVKQLKHFFVDALEKKKLQKAKDVVYDKNTQEVIEVPGLSFNSISRKFTLRTDPKHVSTLKSLTPKRTSEKQRISIEENKSSKN